MPRHAGRKMPYPQKPMPHFRTIAMIIGTAMFMEGLDSTILATGLPAMSRELGAPATVMSIALTSYLISLAIFIPASGRIADRYGARNILRTAIITFTLGSILCAQAPNLTFLVLARFLQGIGGAMMVPVGRLVLIRSVEKRHMIAAMSWVLVPALIGPILGPPVGGFIVTYFNWRWMFYINIPIGLLGIVLATIFLQETQSEAARPFDVMGMILSGLSLGPLLFGFEMASHPGALDVALGLLVFGTVAGLIYLSHARRTEEPILDPRLMRVPTFRISLIAGSITRITQGAQPYLLPLMLQLGFGFSALESGSMTLATALGSFCMKPFAPKILQRFGFRDTLVVGGILATAGYASCAAFRPDWPFPVIFVILLGCGFFMSFQFTAYNTIAFDEIAPEELSSATSFYATFQQLMLSLGICIGAAALAGSMELRHHGAPALSDFSAAFLVVTAISLFATVWNARFAHDAGTELSGHTPRSWSLRRMLKGVREEIPL
jgi:EmrB/QacA subfamily drug resistance transporter